MQGLPCLHEHGAFYAHHDDDDDDDKSVGLLGRGSQRFWTGLRPRSSSSCPAVAMPARLAALCRPRRKAFGRKVFGEYSDDVDHDLSLSIWARCRARWRVLERYLGIATSEEYLSINFECHFVKRPWLSRRSCRSVQQPRRRCPTTSSRWLRPSSVTCRYLRPRRCRALRSLASPWR